MIKTEANKILIKKIKEKWKKIISRRILNFIKNPKVGGNPPIVQIKKNIEIIYI
jgi:hypothetical protein